MATTDEVKNYYDNTFKDYQKNTGINIRHRTIIKNLKKVGLKANSKVLEVGCGIGSVSGLILKEITNGKLVALDISPESIKTAQHIYKDYKQVEFLVNDMTNFSHQEKFDFIIFPDVLEHIPIEQHAHIFKTIAELSNANAVILINIPEPNHLNWLRIHHPEKIQIIDQALSMQDLLNNAYPFGFKLYSAIPYQLHYEVNDYVSIVLMKNMEVKNAPLKSKMIRAIENTKSKLI